MKMATTERRAVMDLNYHATHHNCSHRVATAGDFYFFFRKTQSFFVFLYVLNVSATPKVIACCSPAASRCSGVVKSEHTAVHIHFTARRAKHTGAGGHAEPSLCSLKPRASEESRSIVSRFLCLGREEGLVSCEGRLESACEISGAAASTPSLGWQFASTWRWFTQTAKCIADLPACWMDG